MTILTTPLRSSATSGATDTPAPRDAANEPIAHDSPNMECGMPSEPTGPLWVTVKLEEAASALIMAALALITLANVLTRYVIDFSLAFTEEYSIILLLILIFVGVSSAIAKNSHIKVTFFLERLGTSTRHKLEVVGDLAMLVCFGVLVFYGTRSAVSSWELGETSPGLGNPQWLYLMWVPILAAVAMLRVIGSLIRLARKRRK